MTASNAPSATVAPEGDALHLGSSADARGAEHLLSSVQDHPHGPDRFSSRAASAARKTGYCGRKPEPNAPPTVGGDDPDLVGPEARSVAEVVADILHALGLVVDGERAILGPNHRRREDLHRVVVLDGHVVLEIDPHRGCGEGLIGVAACFGRRLDAVHAPSACGLDSPG